MPIPARVNGFELKIEMRHDEWVHYENKIVVSLSTIPPRFPQHFFAIPEIPDGWVELL